MLDFVFDFGEFWVPSWTHFGTPNRPSWGSILGHFWDVGLGAVLGRSWGDLGLDLGASWGPFWRPSWPKFGPKRL